jgi:hypothetical protein
MRKRIRTIKKHLGQGSKAAAKAVAEAEAKAEAAAKAGIVSRVAAPTLDYSDYFRANGIGYVWAGIYLRKVNQAQSLLESGDIKGVETANKAASFILTRINCGRDGVPDLILSVEGVISAAEANDIPQIQRHLEEVREWLSEARAGAELRKKAREQLEQVSSGTLGPQDPGDSQD